MSVKGRGSSGMMVPTDTPGEFFLPHVGRHVRIVEWRTRSVTLLPEGIYQPPLDGEAFIQRFWVEGVGNGLVRLHVGDAVHLHDAGALRAWGYSFPTAASDLLARCEVAIDHPEEFPNSQKLVKELQEVLASYVMALPNEFVAVHVKAGATVRMETSLPIRLHMMLLEKRPHR
jgi:hypothetical protein